MERLAALRIDVPPEFHRQLKVRAMNEGKTLGQLLREFVEAGAATPSPTVSAATAKKQK